jgi:ABC-2 type transport system permease protein
MKALSIAFKDLRILFKDRGSLVLLILLPLFFIVVMSGALTSLGQEPVEDTRISLPVVDLDRGPEAQALIQGIGEAGGIRVELLDDEAEARSMLAEADIERLLVVPAGFGLMGIDNQVTLTLINHPDADSKVTGAVRLVVEGVARDMALEVMILASLEQMAAMQGNAPQGEQVFTADRSMAQARSQFEASRTQPLVSLRQRLPGQEEERDPALSEVDKATVPGFAVLFVFLAAQTMARSIYDEKKTGSFRRLLAAPMSRYELLVGKMLPNVLAGVIQVTVLFAFGSLGMRLLGLTPMPIEKAPLGVALVSLLLILCSSALGILIAALASTEAQIGGLSSVLLWGMGLLGGSFIPLFFLEGFLGPLPRIVPHYWANRAFNGLLVRNLGLGGVTTEMVVLLGFTAAFLAVGAWRFDFD